jgi:hypothetical protein
MFWCFSVNSAIIQLKRKNVIILTPTWLIIECIMGSQHFDSDHYGIMNSLLLLFLWCIIPSSVCRLHVHIMEIIYIPSDSPRSFTRHLKPRNDVFLSHWSSEDKAIMVSEKILTYHDGFVSDFFYYLFIFYSSMLLSEVHQARYHTKQPQ